MIVAVALWLSGYLVSLIGYHLIHLYPSRMLLHWRVVGLLEMVFASIVGAWIYREP